MPAAPPPQVRPPKHANPSPGRPPRDVWLVRMIVGTIGIIALGVPIVVWFSSPKQPAPSVEKARALPSNAPAESSRAPVAQGASDEGAEQPDAGTNSESDAVPDDARPPVPVVTQRTTRPPDELPPPTGAIPNDPPNDTNSDPPTATDSGAYHRGSGEREARVKRYGGTANTEGAVEAGIAWLAAHQSPDGTWDRFLFERRCPSDDKCGGLPLLRKEHALHGGITGLVLLAFLGAGYTDRDGPYQKQVRLGLDALLALQRPDGGFSPHEGMAGYNDSVGTFALAEYAALTHDQRVIESLRRAVAHLAATQQPLGGWDYLPTPDSGRNDTSITGWAVQAFRAAESAGVEIPRQSLLRAALHIARATGPDGRAWYADAGTGFDVGQDMQPEYRYGSAMTSVALTCAPILGWRLDAPLIRKQQALLLADPPSQALARGRDRDQLHSEYYWYYGTVAMFQAGGDEWSRWNNRLRDAILPLQDRHRFSPEKKHHSFGSWQPYGQGWGKWGRMGGRVYTTAICTLTLEIYYRHTPAFLDDSCVIQPGDWRAFLANATPREKALAVRVLRDSRFEIGEAVLIDLLGDAEENVAFGAALALASIDSPQGRDVLTRDAAPDKGTELDRSQARQALQRIASLDKLDKVEGQIRVFDAERKLGTAELSRAYVGMQLTLRQGGQATGTVRVVERHSGTRIVVIESVVGELPVAGDRLVQQ